MKQKFMIIGPNVHNVGYRQFIAEIAMDISPDGFEVCHDHVDGQQAIVVLIESDEPRIRLFTKSIKMKRPLLAEIHEIKIEDYTGDIKPGWQGIIVGLTTLFPSLQDTHS